VTTDDEVLRDALAAADRMVRSFAAFAEAILPVLRAAAEALNRVAAATREHYVLAPPPIRPKRSGASGHVLLEDEWVLVPGIADFEAQADVEPGPPAPRRPSRPERRGRHPRPAWQSPYGPRTHRH
jgi:hypothetical protein